MKSFTDKNNFAAEEQELIELSTKSYLEKKALIEERMKDAQTDIDRVNLQFKARLAYIEYQQSLSEIKHFNPNIN